MRVHVIHDGDTFPLQCGSGLQRVSWIGRVAAQRLGSGGIWCPPEKEIGRPKEFIPGRIYVYPGDDELDTEATIASLVEGEDGESEVEGEGELHFRVELLDHPASALPSLAACGSEDSVVPPKNANAAVSFLVQETREGKVVTRTPAPPPEPHNGYDFKEVLAEMDISDLCRGLDKMIAAAVTNVLSNSFAALVDIFLHYASPCKVAGVDDPEEVTLAISMKSMATIVRTCRLCSETCSFFEIQRASVRPALLLPAGDEDFSLGVYDADYGLPQFFEALVRIAAVKKFGLVALCDQVNRLIHTQILPYATGDDEDRIRDLTQKPAIQQMFYNQRNGLRKFFSKRMRLEKPTGARSISLAEFISCLKSSDQIDEELTPAAVKEIWIATLAFDVLPETITEGDTTLEVTLSELEEVVTRCVLQKSKVSEDQLPAQCDLFIKRFLRANL